MKEWTAAAGSNNFAADPPNATISVFDKAAKVNTLAVVEISKPKLEDRDLVYRYRLIEGKMPRGGGATALFIDWIGVGGGVGPGTISTVLALALSVMVLRPGSSAGRNSSLISRFLGLILIAMGLQFVLTNLRAFFQAAG